MDWTNVHFHVMVKMLDDKMDVNPSRRQTHMMLTTATDDVADTITLSWRPLARLKRKDYSLQLRGDEYVMFTVCADVPTNAMEFCNFVELAPEDGKNDRVTLQGEIIYIGRPATLTVDVEHVRMTTRITGIDVTIAKKDMVAWFDAMRLYLDYHFRVAAS
jgi:hypothetical protein